MSKMVAMNPLQVAYDPARRGTHWTIDGRKWLNAGELAEVIAKALHHLAPVKDGKTAFDEGSDIPEFGASVKSSEGSLTEKPLAGTTYAEMLDDYFRRVASSNFWWVERNGNVITIYKMKAPLFRRFMERFAKYRPCDKKIRFAKTNEKMLKWLEANAA